MRLWGSESGLKKKEIHIVFRVPDLFLEKTPKTYFTYFWVFSWNTKKFEQVLLKSLFFNGKRKKTQSEIKE